MENNREYSVLLLFSSFIFITNALTSYYKEYYVYCCLFVCLTITSLIFHYNTNIYTTILDKVFILAIVSYGGYVLYNKTTIDNQIYVLLSVITFVLCVFLFCYGYCIGDYCYHPDRHIGDVYHSMLHIISSIGHHIIIFL